MSGQANFTSIQAAFQQAVLDFRTKVKDDVYQQILATKTIDDVYDATNQLQKEQAKDGHLRHLKRIEPFLENLREYAAVIEVFLQSKPDVLALIWGPIKLLLQWTNVLKQSFDAITNTLGEIGNLLPEFKKMAGLFKNKPQVNHVLLLFFKDILEFYAIALKFFGLPRWSILFESMWPRHREKIKVIMENIERHKLLFRNEVRLEEIEAAHQARLKALQHFEAAEKSHRHQEYHAIRQYISPRSYAEKLSWLDLRTCSGTEKWLTTDTTFKKWADTADLTTKFLWLQGIPGAGKTFLSGLVVKKLIPTNETAYAFISYSQADSTSALSVLQSLLFHLAEDHADVQDALCRSSRTSLKSDIEMTFNLLLTAISFLGTVFIVVDGLDEIQERDRRALLRQLLRLHAACKEVKIMVSSRAESDIQLQLKDQPTIRADIHNTASIERFVIKNTEEWFQDNQFSADMQSEIRALLATLPSNSHGMFLYARIVLDSVKILDTLEDVRAELKVLPASLDEAYARIFARINRSKPIIKHRARMILSWVGCCPSPLTIQELEAALSIKYDSHIVNRDDKSAGALDVTKYCGPIVEIVNEFVQFVHFTVKEYVFSVQIPEHIDTSDATLELALCCVFYLGQLHHDPDLTDDAIAQGILVGYYRLHNVAKTSWYRLVETYLASVSSQRISPRLLSHLNTFMNCKWANKESPEQNLRGDASNYVLSPMKTSSPQVHAFLSAFKHFDDLLKTSEFNMDEPNWTHLDPTSTSQVSMRLYHKMNGMLSCLSDESKVVERTALERYYGSRPFKCKFVSCAYHYHGFESYTLRRMHMKDHERPWTCSITECEFANQGFLSRKMRDEHMGRYHSPVKSTSQLNLETDEVDLSQALVTDLIEADEVELLRSLWHQSRDLKSRLSDIESYKSAAFSSPEMFQLVHDIFMEPFLVRTTMVESVEANNLEMFRYIKNNLIDLIGDEKLDKRDVSLLTAAALSTDDEEIWEDWYSSLSSFIDDKLFDIKSKVNYFWYGVYQKVVQEDSKQSMLMRIWELLIKKDLMNQKDLGSILCAVAQHPSLTRVAEFCLDSGVDADFRLSNTYPTPLHHAVRRSSADAAAMIKLLLFRGADPNPEIQPKKSGSQKAAKKISEEIGAVEIEKWLGITWAELVAETEPYRKQKAAEASANEAKKKTEEEYEAE